MMGSEMRYGALSAKVHALYGKRLRAADFAALAERKDPAEILEALRRHPGWSRGLAQAAPEGWSYVGRVEVERALWEELELEYLSLAHYVPREDRELIRFHREMIRIHKENPALRTGSVKFLNGTRNMLCYGRFNRQQQFVVIVNNEAYPNTMDLSVRSVGIPMECTVNQVMYSTQDSFSVVPVEYVINRGRLKITLPKYSSVVLKHENNS